MSSTTVTPRLPGTNVDEVSRLERFGWSLNSANVALPSLGAADYSRENFQGGLDISTGPRSDYPTSPWLRLASYASTRRRLATERADHGSKEQKTKRRKKGSTGGSTVPGVRKSATRGKIVKRGGKSARGGKQMAATVG